MLGAQEKTRKVNNHAGFSLISGGEGGTLRQAGSKAIHINVFKEF